jgi:hypothetical protein
MSELDVYITEDCWSCQEAKRIVADIRPLFPEITIRLRDLDDPLKPSRVFATPTYLLNGRTIFLGNPTVEELKQKLETLSK